MKILNLYAGIGGNRKLWKDVDVTAVENNKNIARIYQDFFPNDKMIIDDAHDYLLKHFEEFDFIWSSPPCPTHSRIRKVFGTQNKPVYPDMKLYEEILLLKHYFKGKYVIENVLSFYKPLIQPFEVAKHYWWANFIIHQIPKESRMHYASINDLELRKGFDLSKYKGVDKCMLLRNCVEPEVGLYVFNCAYNPKQNLKLL